MSTAITVWTSAAALCALQGDAVVTVAVDGTFAGRIELEPNTEPVNYACVSNLWRTTNPTELDSWNTSERQ